MRKSSQQSSAGGIFILLFVLLNAIILERGLVSDPKWYKLAFMTVPVLLALIILSRGRIMKTSDGEAGNYPTHK